MPKFTQTYQNSYQIIWPGFLKIVDIEKVDYLKIRKTAVSTFYLSTLDIL